MQPFEHYLQQHKLDALAVSIAARVRYLTVYNAKKGIPITPQHADRIRQAISTMTGTPFTGSFVLTEPVLIEEIPTIQIKKIPKHPAT